MKYHIILLFTILFVNGCIDNKDIITNEDIDFVISVSNINITEEMDIHLGDTLYVYPQIEYTQNSKEEDYSFQWIIGKEEIISVEKNLVWGIRLPVDYKIKSKIPIVFKIKNETNGLEFRKVYNVIINTGYAPKYVAVYEDTDGNIDWLSIQGDNPASFTRFFPEMCKRVIGKAIPGNYKGSLKAKNEMLIFTDLAPEYGYSVCTVDSDETSGNDFIANIGEWIAPINGRIYRGDKTNLNFSHINFAEGNLRTIMQNDNLYAFSNSTNYPIFNDETYLKATNVKQTVLSKQFMRYKKSTFVRYENNEIDVFHVYNDELDKLFINDERFTLDSICGCFTEATGLGSNQAYKSHLIGKKSGQYHLYIFDVKYVGTQVQPVVLDKQIPIPEDIGKQAKYWFGAFAEKYGFYATSNSIYKFDYYLIDQFPNNLQPFINFSSEYEILDVYVQLGGTGLRDADDCVVIFLYNKSKNTTTIYVYETISGEKMAEYVDIIPGKGLHLYKI